MIADRIESIRCHNAGHWIFVDIMTEKGVRGIGEATYFPHPLAVRAVVDDLKFELVGDDPFRPEWHFNRLLKHHCIRDAVLMAALSAIDQALWDIKAKALDVPLWQLFGGRVRDKVRAILLIEAVSEAEIIEKSLAARDEGFTAIKIKPFIGNWTRRTGVDLITSVAAIVRNVREAVGWKMDMAIEIHRNLTPDIAEIFALEIAAVRPYFIEDPVLPFSIMANAQTAQRISGTVALAERNTNIWEFREYSDCPGVSILRPDVGLAGGFTQLKKISAIAESRHQRIVPHNFTSPVVTACHIQLAACTNNWDVQGYVREDRAPWNQVVKSINKLDKGFLAIPDAPGIGMELNDDYFQNAAYTPWGQAFGHGAGIGADGGIRHQ
ncbi:MAG: hypothetical protein DCC73_09850 [Proteobacteria bacterium]|nr:MAG: hypothetical protein DCC73_09850 [Pseudomonadota bacterium]